MAKKTISIRYKLIGAILIPIMLLGAGVLFIGWYTYGPSLATEIIKKGIADSEYLAIVGLDPMLERNYDRITQLAYEEKKVDLSIAYIFFLDEKRHVVAHTFSDGFPVDLVDANWASMEDEDPARLLRSRETSIYDIAVPIRAGGIRIGEVRIGIHKAYIDQPLEHFMTVLSLSVVAIATLGTAFSIFRANQIIRPLRRLTRRAERLGTRDLDYPIVIKTGDEIELLAKAFNRMGERLKSAYTELERKVADRTRELESRNRELSEMNTALRRTQSAIVFTLEDLDESNEKLRETTQSLQEKTQEMEEFLYSVSHDLRAPVVTINGFSNILLEDYCSILDDEAMHYLERIKVNTKHMERLIDDLLQLSRIGRVPLRLESVRLSDLIDEVLTTLRSPIEEREGKVRVGDDLPTIRCDRKEIQRVLLNLIENANKHCGDGESPEIDIGCQEDERYYRIFVRDNGPGIDPNYHDKIFRVFQQLEANQQGGTGIGLAIVKKAVEMHKGTVWVESESGQGATFFFTIPKAGLA